jgi:hypothetical protein
MLFFLNKHISTKEETMQEEQKQHEDKKTNAENLWDSTLKTFHNVTNQATRYTRLAQKKIDLSSLYKKISSAHSDLGKLIDECRDSGVADIFEKVEVKAVLQNLDSLKQNAARLIEEIETLKQEPLTESSDKSEPTKQ